MPSIFVSGSSLTKRSRHIVFGLFHTLVEAAMLLRGQQKEEGVEHEHVLSIHHVTWPIPTAKVRAFCRRLQSGKTPMTHEILALLAL